MQHRYVTVDVFTDRMFGGNPLAVVLDGGGLSTEAMQSIAAEFNYSETTFVLPPRDASHTARVRIFTPRSEVPFAGHPNVGTAYVLAHERLAHGMDVADPLLFEEAAGIVPVALLRSGGAIVGAELQAPERLSRRSLVAREVVAECLSIGPADVAVTVHEPQVVSVGLPFLVAELASRDALRRSRPDVAAHERVLPLDGADGVFAYTRDDSVSAGAGPTVLHARMFAPLDGVMEDPATGSATAATIALLTSLDPSVSDDRSWHVHQGVDMGRPGLLTGRTVQHHGEVSAVHVGGHCVTVMQGALREPKS